jgi:superfamily II DNA or RNA helicase
MVQVDFGPNERQFKHYNLLELVAEEQDPLDTLRHGPYGGPDDLRRVLTFEKIKGELTNVFYSMEASNTDFYAHQFKPVMRFIESAAGRLLIADEVGLGKTIEATYIWKELQARQGARRLLIVCPAMLRDKWRNDLRNRFDIPVEIVTSQALLEKLQEVASRRSSDAFVFVTSLEGLRPPADFHDGTLQSARVKLARLLDEHTATADYALFDYVVIDEAHYLRNPSTGNNRIGRLLREASHHLVLLTATPVQLASDNLYQLLRLVDPDVFYDSSLFQEMLQANAHIVRAQRALWRHPPDFKEAGDAITAAEATDYFKSDPVLGRIRGQLSAATAVETRVELLRLLESRSLLAQFMTRSRKREVLEKRVERAPQVLSVALSETEKSIYDQVTQRIRAQTAGRTGVSLFSLIARQRQMASSIVGALESWNDKGLMDELLWDDLGVSVEDLSNTENGHSLETDRHDGLVAYGSTFDIAQLEAQDSKYRALSEFLSRELASSPGEKFVVFAFFRGTLKYLKRRLAQDGIEAALLMGGMENPSEDILQLFSRPDGPPVLLSSEVGSEGIDLQFCRFVVNYDLPWNPMRVEQRIGRLDRLGQKADRISIVNLYVSNTIEDRILQRLYDRINVFRESIGDIEEILGGITEKLIVELFDPTLSDAERERRSADAALSIQGNLLQQRQLEEEAVNLIGFSDYILDQIQDSRAKGRWLSSAELRSLVYDFFARKYPGTHLESLKEHDGAVRIMLSDAAKSDLGYFIESTRPAAHTRLHRSHRPVACLFDPRRSQRRGQETELIEPNHPLIQWIRADYARDRSQLHRVAAIKIDAGVTVVPPGDYVFSSQHWSLEGLKSERLLAFSVTRIGHTIPLDDAVSEQLINIAASEGKSWPNALNLVADIDAVCEGALACEQRLSESFESRLNDFQAENTARCDQQETSAHKFAERRVAELQSRIERFRAANTRNLIPMTEGLIRKEEEQLRMKLDRVARRKAADPTMVSLAMGLIRIE